MDLKKIKDLVDIRESVDDETFSDIFFKISHLHGVTEATFEDSKRRARVTVITEGTSENKFHYGEKALLDVVEHLTNNKHAKKVYLNHQPKGSKQPRKVEDWVATVESAELVTDNGIKQVKANISILESGPNAWVYDRMKSNPDEFGPSIVGKAKISIGIVGGERVKVVEAIPMLSSFDLVAEPSAGGKVDVVMESVEWTEDDTEISEELKKYIEKITRREKEREIENEFYNLSQSFDSILRDLVLASSESDYATMSIDDRKKELPKIFTDMLTLISKLTFLPPEKENKEKDKDKETITENINESVESEDSCMNLKELKEKHPELFTTIVTEAIDSYKNEQASSGLKEKVVELTEAITVKDTEIATLKENVNTLDTDNVSLKDKLSKYQNSEISEAKANIIAEVIKEVDLKESAVTKHFSTKLNEIELVEGKEDEFKATIKLECEDRKAVIGESVKTVKNNGPIGNKSETKSEDVSESKYPMPTTEFAKKLKSN